MVHTHYSDQNHIPPFSNQDAARRTVQKAIPKCRSVMAFPPLAVRSMWTEQNRLMEWECCRREGKHFQNWIPSVYSPIQIILSRIVPIYLSTTELGGHWAAGNLDGGKTNCFTLLKPSSNPCLPKCVCFYKMLLALNFLHLHGLFKPQFCETCLCFLESSKR